MNIVVEKTTASSLVMVNGSSTVFTRVSQFSSTRLFQVEWETQRARERENQVGIISYVNVSQKGGLVSIKNSKFITFINDIFLMFQRGESQFHSIPLFYRVTRKR